MKSSGKRLKPVPGLLNLQVSALKILRLAVLAQDDRGILRFAKDDKIVDGERDICPRLPNCAAGRTIAMYNSPAGQLLCKISICSKDPSARSARSG